MEDIKVGDFVRTKKGCICQILRTTYSKYLSRNKEFCYEVDRPINVNMELYDEDIVKHSSKIIDLIEVGDIISLNYMGRVFKVIKTDENRIYGAYETLSKSTMLQDYKVKIVTKEQFKSVSYEVR